MIKVNRLRGENRSISEEEFYERVGSLTYCASEPFSEKRIDLLNRLSRVFLTSVNSRLNPQITALGFWLRKSSIKKIRNDFLNRQPENTILSARGIAFHLPPANVDTLFVYSWALAFLTGNVNIVRMPETPSEIATYLVGAILEVLNDTEEKDNHIFCSYDYKNEVNARLSGLSDLRMIWGGDAKVELISRSPMRADGVSLGFPDRYSYSLISEKEFVRLDGPIKKDLIEKFYNDLYWFDQMGCGSPRILYWQGQDNKAILEFEKMLSNHATDKGYNPDTNIVFNKFVFLNEMLANNNAMLGKVHSNALHTLEADINTDLRNGSPGGGLLTIVKVPSIMDITSFAKRKDQTITHFGFTKEEITLFAKSIRGKGGYRIVPIGQALDFGPIWDGIDLLSDMTRKIVLMVNAE